MAAESGDLIYAAPTVQVQITGARAATYAGLAVEDGAWSGELSGMDAITLQRVRIDGAPDEYKLSARGSKTSPADGVPVGVEFLGVVP